MSLRALSAPLFATVFAAVLAVFAAACDPPRTDVPDELAGPWFEGDLSNIQFYDDVTGEWAPTNGSGFYYIFDEHGDYESGAIITVTTYGCTSQLLGQEVGTVTVDGDQLVTHRQQGQTHFDNTCGEDSDNALGAESLEFTWEVGEDEYGTTLLTLTWPDGEESLFYRWE